MNESLRSNFDTKCDNQKLLMTLQKICVQIICVSYVVVSCLNDYNFHETYLCLHRYIKFQLSPISFKTDVIK